MARTLPRYPIYVPSKGRADACLTGKFLRRDGCPFSLVIEQEEFDAYAAVFGPECLLVLPFSNAGSVIPARNWIKQHATAAGHARHWQLDDNIREIRRRWNHYRIPCAAGLALRCTEDFVERYENVAIAGLNYTMFVPDDSDIPPFLLNVHVYSCTLVLNALPFEWRGRYNEDTDYCLQVLSAGWCTIAMNAFLATKITTMLMKGGNTDALYQGDGRLAMARELERRWPGVVETKRRFRRPQHVVKGQWRSFDTPLRRRADLDWDALAHADSEHGMRVTQVKATRDATLRDALAGSSLRGPRG